MPAERLNKDAQVLFSESASRFVVTVAPENREKFVQAMEGVPCEAIGHIRDDDRFLVRGLDGMLVIDTIAGAMKDSWQSPLRW